jgi:hypothetical protein
MSRRRFDPLTVFGVPMVGGGLILPNLQTPWYVNGDWTGQFGTGREMDKPLATIAAAVAAAAAGDIIFIAPGEYDEDVVVSTSRLTLIGCGPRHSVRVTGTAAGTATALTISAASDIGLYNLNLEGRSGGAGLSITGQVRRVEVRHCKIHGGDDACLLDQGAGQIVDVRIEDCVIGNAADGLVIGTTGGGDPNAQIVVRNCLFSKCTADCIKTVGFMNDLVVDGCTFTAASGTEPTQFLDVDDVGTTGIITNCRFHTTVFSTAKFGIATDVFFAQNYTEAEGSSSTATGTASGRPN